MIFLHNKHCKHRLSVNINEEIGHDVAYDADDKEDKDLIESVSSIKLIMTNNQVRHSHIQESYDKRQILVQNLNRCVLTL